MIKLLNNLFKSKKKTFKDKVNFKELVSKKEIQQLFKSFNSYSNEAELRFVGGCVRKLLNDEIVDDIDLSTNLKPENVIEILKKNNINFYETGIDHGTITAVINEKSLNAQVLEAYEEGLKSLKQGDVVYAAKKFNEAEILFPQSEWAPKSALMAAYSYYTQDYYGDAIA